MRFQSFRQLGSSSHLSPCTTLNSNSNSITSLYSHIKNRRPFGSTPARLFSSQLIEAIKPHPAPDSRSFRISAEVRDALNAGKPVLALESTIYTHGYPHPQNVELANELEQVVRSAGVVPATIGIVNGVATVGLSKPEIEQLASSVGASRTLKLSRRDLAFACGVQFGSQKFNGGTTIASTMILAHRAGIQVFATGGLGGVHRGGEDSMDISADLTELGRTPVAVVSSGCKSFLDIKRTLEYLETQGVGVVTFCDPESSASSDGFPPPTDFPAFWSRQSGMKSPMTIFNEDDAAMMIMKQYELGIQSGLLFANPIPKDSEIPFHQMEVIIQKAVNEANERGVGGKDNTPYVLKRIRELTDGKSVSVNRDLIRSNVERGSIVAQKLSEIQRDWDRRDHKPVPISPKNIIRFGKPRCLPKVVVAGGLAIDYTCDLISDVPQVRSSNPAKISQSLGGVGHNVARAAHLLIGDNDAVQLCSAVASDLAGHSALNILSRSGMNIDGIFQFPTQATDIRTAQYVAINNTAKDLHFGLADMSILEDPRLETPLQTKWKNVLDLGSRKPDWLVLDANWPFDHLRHWIEYADRAGVKVAFEPVSMAKAPRLMEALGAIKMASTSSPTGDTTATISYPYHRVHLVTPNRDELKVLHSNLHLTGETGVEWAKQLAAISTSSSSISDLFPSDPDIPQMCLDLLPFFQTVLVTLGSRGVFVAAIVENCNDGETRGAGFTLSNLASATSPSGGNIITNNTSGNKNFKKIFMKHFPPEPMSRHEIVSANGAGDTLLGALIASFVTNPDRPIEESIRIGQRAAGVSLKSGDAVPNDLGQLRDTLMR